MKISAHILMSFEKLSSSYDIYSYRIGGSILPTMKGLETYLPIWMTQVIYYVNFLPGVQDIMSISCASQLTFNLVVSGPSLDIISI